MRGIEYFKAIAFHPNNKFIAGLIAPDNFIFYMDTTKEHRICTITPFSYSRFFNDDSISFSFSSNGELLMIMGNKACYIMNVPFEVIYQDDTKAKLPILFFFLNTIKKNFLITIPGEIITMLKKNQINVFKR